MAVRPQTRAHETTKTLTNDIAEKTETEKQSVPSDTSSRFRDSYTGDIHLFFVQKYLGKILLTEIMLSPCFAT